MKIRLTTIFTNARIEPITQVLTEEQLLERYPDFKLPKLNKEPKFTEIYYFKDGKWHETMHTRFVNWN